jgi:hypothetical protein
VSTNEARIDWKAATKAADELGPRSQRLVREHNRAELIELLPRFVETCEKRQLPFGLAYERLAEIVKVSIAASKRNTVSDWADQLGSPANDRRSSRTVATTGAPPSRSKLTAA